MFWILLIALAPLVLTAAALLLIGAVAWWKRPADKPAVACGTCAHRNLGGAVYCARCGDELVARAAKCEAGPDLAPLQWRPREPVWMQSPRWPQTYSTSTTTITLTPFSPPSQRPKPRRPHAAG